MAVMAVRLDESRLFDDSHEDHHADEQADSVEINEAKGVFLGDQPEKEYSGKSRHCRLQTMHLFADDEREGRDEDDPRKPLLSIHDARPSWNAETNPRKKRQRWPLPPCRPNSPPRRFPPMFHGKSQKDFPWEKNSPATRGCVCLLDADVHDLQPADSFGNTHEHFLTDLLPHERLTDRARGGNAVFLRVGFLGTHDGIDEVLS